VRVPPNLVPGAVAIPADDAAAVDNLRDKVEAGAAFVQTQLGFDTGLFAAWMRRVRAAGLHERVAILAGVAPVRRLDIARYLRDHVPGVSLPDAVLRRLERARDVEQEGICLAAERLRDVHGMAGVAGAHIMTFGWSDGVGRVLATAGIRTT
jgi:methylenetetrahydrofolate reductase (NADPH)